MFRRSLTDNTIRVLNASRLWNNLVEDKELHPQIREDVITVYYRGGALLKDLKVNNGALTAEVHPKFVPPSANASGGYLSLMGNGNGGLSFAQPLGPKPIGSADAATLEAYKDQMDLVLASFPEGQVVQEICCREENQILDQEIAFQESGGSRDKIDLCHFDTDLRKLVFVEVKRKDDARLDRPEPRPEVLDQLAAYRDRIHRNRDAIRQIYQQVIAWKRDLGLGGRIEGVPRDVPIDLLEKPVLVIGNCSRVDVRMIKCGEGNWRPLRDGLSEVAAGFILCGRKGCRLNLVNGSQTVVF